MSWEFDQDRPLYAQLIEKLQRAIVSGAYEPGAKIPSVRELAAEAGVNPNTMQKALTELEQQGLIYPVKGKGNFVADSRSVRDAGIFTLHQELKSLVKKGKSMGVQEQEMQEMLHDCYKEGNI